MANRILILDDERAYAQMIHQLVSSYGYEAEALDDPMEAVQRLRSRSYALVVADYKMPRLNGAQFLHEARKMDPELPVIMVSGFMNAPELIKVANIGVTLVLEKPFDTKVFLDYVRRFAEPRRDKPDTPAASKAAPARTMPEELRYLAPQSQSIKRFARQLWKQAQSGFALVDLPAGAEIDLVAAEVLQHWSQSSSSALRRVSTYDLTGDEVLAHLHQMAAGGVRLVVVDDDTSCDPAQRERVEQFYEEWQKAGEERPDLTVLIRLQSAHAVFEGAELVPLYLEPLARRKGDLATYTLRLLDASTSIGRVYGAVDDLDAECIRVLLNYDWPGEYRELFQVLNRARALSPKGELVADALERAIRYRHGDLPDDIRKAGLRAYLKRAQGIYEREMASTGEDLASGGSGAGILRQAVAGEFEQAFRELLPERPSWPSQNS